MALDAAKQYDDQHDGAQRHVQAMETGEHVKSRAIDTRAKLQVQILIGVHVFDTLQINLGS